MKQTLLVGLLLCICHTASIAYHEISDSSALPITQAFSKKSLVGGFSFGSLFEESESFSKGSWILHLGSGFKSDVVTDATGLKKVIPPLSFLLEKSVGKNFGIGLRGGFRMWEISKLDYQYQYYTASLRATYHPNIHPKLDPYIGVSGVGRLVRATGNQPEVTNKNYDYSFFIGGRYYLTSRLGIFIEFGADGLIQYHGGLIFKLK
ncbi:MAG: hypothetical protein ACI85O_001018 [Saprospiraceae bacterium]|jgi:hypothetical protein